MIEAFDLHKTYQDLAKPLTVLKGVSLKINHGDVVSIIGPSGAGKSTLLHILGGLDKPSEGKVILDGKEIYALNDRERAEIRNTEIGFVFQFYYLLPEFTALENIMLPGFIKKENTKRSTLEDKGLTLLEKVGLRQRAAHRPSQLSGGEQQRIAIARALMNNPKIIFCDEPTGNLDSQSAENVLQTLLQLNREYKQTLVIVTHDEHIAKRSRVIYHLHDGKIVHY